MPSFSTLRQEGDTRDGKWTVSLDVLFSKRLTRHLESERGAASLGFPAYIQVTSAFPSSCSKPPSSRWDRALGYPPPNTGNPPMPPAVGDSSSGGTGLLTARLTERLDTSLCTDKAWRQEGHRNRSYIYHSQTDSNYASLLQSSFSVFYY